MHAGSAEPPSPAPPRGSWVWGLEGGRLGGVIGGAGRVGRGFSPASTTAGVAKGAPPAVAARGEPANASTAATDYFVDLLFRPGPASATNNATSANAPQPSDTVG